MSAATLRALLSGLIDYAGLYPPAGLPMARVVSNFAAYRSSEHQWALGRLIVPTSQLDEFISALDTLEITTASPWHISAIPGDDIDEAWRTISRFNEQHRPRCIIDSMEFRPPTPESVMHLAELTGDKVHRFAECPAGQIGEYVEVLRQTGTAAKIRTGGVTRGAFPATGAIGAFMHALGRDVAFKATAGLHHPVRSAHPLTYEPGAPCGTMHGFLNVFMAAAFVRNGAADDVIRGVLDESDATAFRFSDATLHWRDHSLTLADVTATRRTFALSFGSCSFREPIDDLIALGFL